MKEKIKKILEKLSEGENFEVFIPEKESFGDYSSNILFVLAKKQKKSPREIGENLKKRLLEKESRIFEKIEVHPSGFLNLWLKREIYLKQFLTTTNQPENFKKNQKTKILIEFISANPTGPLTIGHGRGAFLGDCLKNLLNFLGYQAISEYYVNNAKNSTQIKELGKTGLGKGFVYLTDELKSLISELKPRIERIKLKNRKNPEGEVGYLLAKKIQATNKNFLERELKIKFDKWFEEESLYKQGEVEKLVKILEKKNLIYWKEGALWFKSSDYGDEKDRVLIRKTGEPTYFLSDLAYHLDKLEKRKFDLAVDIWGADHYGYQNRLIAGLEALGINGKRVKIIITQLLTLRRGKKRVRISKREGNYLSLKEIISEIGKEATRFFFLLYSPDSHMDFDLKLAKKRSLNNPLYYLQYALVRGESIVKKSKTKDQKQKFKPNSQYFNLLNTEEDLKLVKKLIEFGDKVEEAGLKFSPQILVHYGLNLAKTFQYFYEKEKVIVEDKKLSQARLWLVSKFLDVMYNIFDILGLEKIKKM